MQGTETTVSGSSTEDSKETESPSDPVDPADSKKTGSPSDPVDPADSKKTEDPSDPVDSTDLKKKDSPEADPVAQVQEMIDALPDGDAVTAENAKEVENQLTAIDEAKAALSDEELDALDVTRYMAAVAALNALNGQEGAGEPAPMNAGAVTYKKDSTSYNATYYIYANGTPLILQAGTDGSNYTVIYVDEDGDGKVTEEDIWEPDGLNAGTRGNRYSNLYIYGGGNTDAVTGNTSVTMLGGSVTAIYGGSSEGTVSGDTKVAIHGGTVSSVYGAGRSAASSVTGNTVVTMDGGTVGNSVFGGGSDGTVGGSTSVTVTGGTVTDHVCGGSSGTSGGTSGTTGAIGGSTSVSVGGSASVGAVVGGSYYSGKVTGSTSVAISGGTVGSTDDASSYFAICGSGYEAAVDGDATISITGGVVNGDVFGTSYRSSATVGGNVWMTVKDATVTKSVRARGAANVGGNVSLTVGGAAKIGNAEETFYYNGIILNSKSVTVGIDRFEIEPDLRGDAKLYLYLPSDYTFTDEPVVATEGIQNDISYMELKGAATVPDGMGLHLDGTNIYIGQPKAVGTPVAEVTTANETTTYGYAQDGTYQTAAEALQAAWSAAQGADSATVNLLADVDLGNVPLTVEEGDNITFQGGDYVLSGKNSLKGGVIEVSGGELTVISGSIAETSSYNGVYVSGGKVTVRGGAVSGGVGIYIDGGTVDIQSGSVTGTNSLNAYGVRAENNSTVTVSGGTVSGTNTSQTGYGLSVKKSTVTITGGTFIGTGKISGYGLYAYGSTVTIEGGTFTGSGTNAYGFYFYPSSGTAEISGGTFTGNASGINKYAIWCFGTEVGKLLKGGYAYYRDTVSKDTKISDTSPDNLKGTVVVAEEDPAIAVATVETSAGTVTYSYSQGGTYKTAADAFEAAWEAAQGAGSAIVTLLADVTLSYSLPVEEGDHITFEGRTHKLSRTGQIASVFWVGGGELTINSGTIEYTDPPENMSQYSVFVFGSGKVTINGGTISGTHGIDVSGGTVDITGGVITGTGSTGHGISAKGGTVTISGGKINGVGDVTKSGYGYGVHASGKSTVIINGGEVSSSGDSTGGVFASGESKVTINSGTVTANGKSPNGVSVNGNSEVTINGGTISGVSTNPNGYGYGVYTYEGTLTVGGGRINGNMYGACIRGGTVSLSGGTFIGGVSSVCFFTSGEGKIVKNLLAEGCAYYKGEKVSLENRIPDDKMTETALNASDDYGTVTVAKDVTLTTPVATVTTSEGTTTYGYAEGGEYPTPAEALQEAWAAAQDADSATVTLLMDVELNSPLLVTEGNDITLLGGDYTISGTIGNDSGMINVTGGMLKIKSGTVQNRAITGSCGVGAIGGTVELSGGTVSGYYGIYVGENAILRMTGGAANGDPYIGVFVYGGTAYISGGAITGKDSGVEVGRGSIGGTAYISGDAMVTSKGNVTTSGVLVGEKASVKISGGTFISQAGVGGLYAVDGSHVTLTGGTFTGNYSVCRSSQSSLTVGDLLAAGYWYYDASGLGVPRKNVKSDALKKADGYGTVTVKGDTLRITRQPADQTISYGTDTALTIGAEALDESNTLVYQWYQVKDDGTADLMPNETDAELTVSGLPVGKYTYYCRVTCGGLTVSSDTATVTVEKKAIKAEVTAWDKTYDGNTDAVVTAVLDTGIDGEELTVSNLTGTFADANVGTGKTVAVHTDGLTYGGNANPENYAVTFPETVRANITSADMTAEAAGYSGVYDGASHGITVTPSEEGASVRFGAEEGTYDQDEVTYTDAGTYTVYYQVTKDNYTTVTGSATVEIHKAGQAAPSLTVVHESIHGKADGAINGLTTAMEIRSGGENYVAVTDAEMPFAAGTYYVRYAADGNHDASADTAVTVEAGRMLTVTFTADGTVTTREVEWDASLTDIPDIPAKAGYDQTAPHWDTDEFTHIRQDMTVTAVYTINTYSVTLPENTIGYAVETEQDGTVEYGGSFTFTVSVAEGYSETADFAVRVNGGAVAPDENGSYTISDIREDLVVTVEGVADITPPDAEVAIGDNKWNSFWNAVTFGLFFRETQSVTITAEDTGSGVDQVYYFLAAKELSRDEVEDISEWTEYTDTFNVEPGKYVIYARITDVSGNPVVINSDGIVVYTESVAETGRVTYTYGENADRMVIIKLNGNTVREVSVGDSALRRDADYTISGGTITLKAAYLDTLNVGEYPLTVSYDPQGVETETVTDLETTIALVVEKAVITDISGTTDSVTAPAALEKVQSAVTAGSGYSAQIGWDCEEDAYDFHTSYTATVTLTPDGNHRFADDITVADGWTMTNAEGVLTLKKTFPATRLEKIISVEAPGDVTLDSHKEDANAVIQTLPDKVQATLEVNGTVDLGIEWSCENYNVAPDAVNTFTWTVPASETDQKFDRNGIALTGTITVANPNALPVTIGGQDTTVTYGGSEIDLAGLFTIGENAGAASYTVENGTGAGTVENGKLTVTRAGTFTVTAKTAAQGIYASGEKSVTLTVNKGVGSGTVSIAGWTYGDVADTPVPASATNGTEGVEYRYESLNGTYDSADAPAGAGNYQVTASFAETDLYQATTAGAEFTIAKKEIEAKVTAWDKTYDGNTDAVVTAVLDTGIDGEELTVSNLTGTFADANVGTEKTVAVHTDGLTYGGTADPANYAVNFPKTVRADIAAAGMTANVAGYSGVYDGASHGITVTPSEEGASVRFGAEEGTYDQDEVTYTDAGTYTVYYQVTKDNYTTVTGSATVEIKKRPVTVTADSREKIYNENDPELTYTASDMAEGDALKGELSREKGEDAGVYAITQGTLTDANNPNYSIAFHGADFTIHKAGQASPSLTVVHESIRGKADGAINGLTTAMEIRSGDEDYVAVTDAEMPFAAGTYYVRYAADGNHDASSDTVVTVEAGRMLTVTFTANGTVTTREVEWDASLTDIPDIPAKAGYDRIAPYWDTNVFTHIRQDMTVTAVYTINTYSVALPENTIGYAVSTDQDGTVEYDGSFTFTVSVEEGYSETEDFAVRVNGEAVAPDENGSYTISDIREDLVVTVEGVADITLPGAEVAIGDNKWNSFWNAVTFGLFFRETQSVTITAEDTGSGVSRVYYFLAEEELSLDEVKAISEWTEYTGTFHIDPDHAYIVYVKAVDNAGNTAYVNSDGVVLDAVAPVISGIENDGVYYGDTTFTAKDDYLDTISVDGRETAPEDGRYVIPADNKEHTILVTDKAGNQTGYTVTVYKVYTVTYIADGRVVSVQRVGYGKDAQAPAIPEKDGYKQTAPVWDQDGKNITDDVTITAVYTADPADPPVIDPSEPKPPVTDPTVTDPSKPESPAQGSSETDSAAAKPASSKTGEPKTGDSAAVWPWFALLFASCAGMIGVAARRGRKKKKTE